MAPGPYVILVKLLYTPNGVPGVSCLERKIREQHPGAWGVPDPHCFLQRRDAEGYLEPGFWMYWPSLDTEHDETVVRTALREGKKLFPGNKMDVAEMTVQELTEFIGRNPFCDLSPVEWNGFENLSQLLGISRNDVPFPTVNSESDQDDAE